MKKILNTTVLVKEILETVPESRSNDKLLYYRVCEILNTNALLMPFGFVMLNLDEYNLPSIETVGRCRRKLQEQFPELRATDKVKGFRTEQERKFEAYARKEIV